MQLNILKQARIGLALLCVLGGALLLASAPALAAAPETPNAEVPTEVTASGAFLHGVLNPGKEGEPGTFELDSYEFVYRPSTKNECKGAGEATTSAGLSLGGEFLARAFRGQLQRKEPQISCPVA